MILCAPDRPYSAVFQVHSDPKLEAEEPQGPQAATTHDCDRIGARNGKERIIWMGTGGHQRPISLHSAEHCRCHDRSAMLFDAFPRRLPYRRSFTGAITQLTSEVPGILCIAQRDVE
jgi:hypothetical protein